MRIWAIYGVTRQSTGYPDKMYYAGRFT